MKAVSDDFKKFFLLHFTRELILHSSSGEVSQLQNLLKGQVKEERENIVQAIKRVLPKKKEELVEKDLEFHDVFKSLKPKPLQRRRVLTIPEMNLPAHLQYLKPIPRDIKIDLEKLEPLMRDPAVKMIECDGPDEHIFVRGNMGAKSTSVVLNKEEIKKVIKKFSELSRIPVQEGIYKVAVGKFILSAIISEVVGSKFIIKKMLYSPNLRNQNSHLVKSNNRY